jgi:hypothetical protein
MAESKGFEVRQKGKKTCKKVQKSPILLHFILWGLFSKSARKEQ